jgi:hypothetical protein
MNCHLVGIVARTTKFKESVPVPLAISSLLACLRQVEGGTNNIWDVVIITITRKGGATYPEVQSRRDEVKVAQDVSPG